MKNLTSIKERILHFIENQDIKISKFYTESGVSYGILSQKSKITEDNIVKFLTKYPQVNSEWLLTGEGSMLKEEKRNGVVVSAVQGVDKGIPLMSLSAVAGFGNANFSIQQADVKEYYVVPKFKYCHVDFMIEISGSSMYPKYNSGDVVACTILHDQSFIQWNKCHIIATREQGILCKRLRPSQQQGSLTAVSDNKDYPPFDIPVSEITGIALVCGVIRLE